MKDGNRKNKHLGVIATLISLVISGTVLTIAGHDGAPILKTAGGALFLYLIFFN